MFTASFYQSDLVAPSWQIMIFSEHYHDLSCLVWNHLNNCPLSSCPSSCPLCPCSLPRFARWWSSFGPPWQPPWCLWRLADFYLRLRGSPWPSWRQCGSHQRCRQLTSQPANTQRTCKGKHEKTTYIWNRWIIWYIVSKIFKDSEYHIVQRSESQVSQQHIEYSAQNSHGSDGSRMVQAWCALSSASSTFRWASLRLETLGHQKLTLPMDQGIGKPTTRLWERLQ